MGGRVSEALLGLEQGKQRGDSATPFATQHH